MVMPDDELAALLGYDEIPWQYTDVGEAAMERREGELADQFDLDNWANAPNRRSQWRPARLLGLPRLGDRAPLRTRSLVMMRGLLSTLSGHSAQHMKSKLLQRQTYQKHTFVGCNTLGLQSSYFSIRVKQNSLPMWRHAVPVRRNIHMVKQLPIPRGIK